MTLSRVCALLVVAPSLLGGCIVEHDHDHDRRHGNPYDSYPDDDSVPQPPVENPSTNASPMLVYVDTGEVMKAEAGEGVGVFVEYAAGGKWHVWWTCDSYKSQRACDFSITASIATGEITDLGRDKLGDGLANATATRLDISGRTSTTADGVTFSTAPGAVLTVGASVAGVGQGESFLFFVQDGKVNGGYVGQLTNPLQFQGKTP